jgi:hypothetical protein
MQDHEPSLDRTQEEARNGRLRACSSRIKSLAHELADTTPELVVQHVSGCVLRHVRFEVLADAVTLHLLQADDIWCKLSNLIYLE